MNDISKSIGQRIRNYRDQKDLSQENLAELSGMHATYIGQVERGEKNVTVKNIEKIASALDVPLSQLFEKLDGENKSDNIPLKCYEFLSAKTGPQQKQLYNLLLEIDKYKNK